MAPAFVAVSTTVTVLWAASQDEVESINIVSLDASSSCARFIIGVATITAHDFLSSELVVLTSMPASNEQTNISLVYFLSNLYHYSRPP